MPPTHLEECLVAGVDEVEGDLGDAEDLLLLLLPRVGGGGGREGGEGRQGDKRSVHVRCPQILRVRYCCNVMITFIPCGEKYNKSNYNC